jgi:SAM-dependent methyltransferase
MSTPSSIATSQYHTTTSNLTSRMAIHAYSTNPTPWFTWLSSRLSVKGNVLEVGAGTGELWKHVDHSAASLTLTDFSPAMVSKLESLQIEGAKVLQCDAASLPFEDGSFDFVIANHMMYHVDDPDAVLQELVRVLKPGGTFYMSINGRGHIKELTTLAKSLGRRGLAVDQAKMTADEARGFLERYFVDIAIENFPGDLRVPSVEPVLAYLGSIGDTPSLSAEQASTARKHIEEEIATHGSFAVSKDTVLVTARRAQ